MYKTEKEILKNRGVKLNPPSSLDDIRLFESRYGMTLPADIKEFYIDLNGYYNGDDMVNLYPLSDVKMVCESELNLPEITGMEQYLILGDFGFQASFWLLEKVDDLYKLYVLNLGTPSLTEVSRSFKTFFSKLLNDPYSVIGMD
jgi:hypothetical protein